MNRGLTYLTLATTNPGKSAEFYESVFEWHRSKESAGVFFFILPNITVALMSHDEITMFCHVEKDQLRSGGTLFSWNVGTHVGVEKMMHRAAKAGAVVQRDAAELPWGGYAGVIRTPDGHLWEIVWNPKSD